MKKYISTTIFSILLSILGFLSLSSCEQKVYDMDQEPPQFKIFIMEKDGMTYTFGNDAEGEYEYYWEFGDEATSREKNPTYSFTFPGDSITIRCIGFSEGFVTANVDSLKCSCEGGTAKPEDFVGDFVATTWADCEPWEEQMDLKVSLSDQPDEILVEGVCRRYRVWYGECGYDVARNNGDLARVKVGEKGQLTIEPQPMFEMEGWDYYANVWVEGHGIYNSETQTFKLDYRLVYLEDSGNYEEPDYPFVPEERILIAKRAGEGVEEGQDNK